MLHLTIPFFPPWQTWWREYLSKRRGLDKGASSSVSVCHAAIPHGIWPQSLWEKHSCVSTEHAETWDRSNWDTQTLQPADLKRRISLKRSKELFITLLAGCGIHHAKGDSDIGSGGCGLCWTHCHSCHCRCVKYNVWFKPNVKRGSKKPQRCSS